MSKKVLIVEDDLYIRQLLSNTLGRYGYEPLEAVGGDEALKAAAEFLPDVILLDLMMPGMDGFEVCKRLKESESTSDIPVIFVTAKAEVEDRIMGFELGAHDYITKPIQTAELVARIGAAMRTKLLQDQLKDKLKLQEDLDTARRQITEQYMNAVFGQLAESLLHEMNNPLAAVVGFAELIKRRNLIADKQAIVLVESIRDMGLRASSKLSSLLCVARADGNKSYVNLNSIINDVMALVNARLLSNRVTAEIMLAEKISEIKGSSNQLARSILALVNNAVDVAETQSDPLRRKIAVSTIELPSNEIKISVEDYGGNISSEASKRLFEPFFTTKAEHHTGLGLYMAKSAAEAHKGRIAWDTCAESTSFHLILPIDN